MESSASGVEAALRLFGAVVDRRSAILMDSIAEESVGCHFSPRRVVVQVPDDLPAQAPEIAYVLANGLGRQT